jgi:hypothetical protein
LFHKQYLSDEISLFDVSIQLQDWERIDMRILDLMKNDHPHETPQYPDYQSLMELLGKIQNFELEKKEISNLLAQNHGQSVLEDQQVSGRYFPPSLNVKL